MVVSRLKIEGTRQVRECGKNTGSTRWTLRSLPNLAGSQQKLHEKHDIVIHLQGRFSENRNNPSNICLEPSI